MLAYLSGGCEAFHSLTPTSLYGQTSTRLASESSSGRIERLEFKIYPDGRVEEMVRGVKGPDCQKLTEKINEALGVVIRSEPTEEMFEQEVKIDQTLTNSNMEGSSGDSWEGASSW
jgi:hypothetical protein